MYLVTHFWPNGTREQYENTVREIIQQSGGERPQGEISHAAGPTTYSQGGSSSSSGSSGGQRGWLIASVWESQQSWEQFKQSTLLPTIDSLQSKSFQGKPQEQTAEVLSHVPASYMSYMGTGQHQQ